MAAARTRRPHRALVLSACLPEGDRGILTAFFPPRGSFLATIEKPSAAPTAVAGEAAPGATLVLDAWREGRLRYDPAPWREQLPDLEVLTVDSEDLLRFLWHYRDRHDPMALGHSRERALFRDEVLRGDVPSPRRHGRREDRRRAVERLRRMILTLGAALGIRPPLPPLSPDPNGWNPKRMAVVLDACAGLFAGLLYRWRAPLARRPHDDDGPDLVLADTVRSREATA
jgi:hypothetical protein